jgi:hypothetical protein
MAVLVENNPRTALLERHATMPIRGYLGLHVHYAGASLLDGLNVSILDLSLHCNRKNMLSKGFVDQVCSDPVTGTCQISNITIILDVGYISVLHGWLIFIGCTILGATLLTLLIKAPLPLN